MSACNQGITKVNIASNGAITQLSGMECYQTWINVGESVGMTIVQSIGPTVLEIVRHYYPTLDKRPAHHESDLTLYIMGLGSI